MQRSMARRLRGLAAVAALAALAGCASHPATPPLYGWEGYQPAVYQNLKAGGDADPQEQIGKLDEGEQKMQSAGQKLPPGYRAMQGMLYVEAGQIDKGQASFDSEKKSFPESAHFMDFLQNNLKGKTQ